jgi:hypothetical protein
VNEDLKTSDILKSPKLTELTLYVNNLTIDTSFKKFMELEKMDITCMKHLGLYHFLHIKQDCDITFLSNNGSFHGTGAEVKEQLLDFFCQKL